MAAGLGVDIEEVQVCRIATGQHARADLAFTTLPAARELFQDIAQHRGILSQLQRKNAAVLTTLKVGAQAYCAGKNLGGQEEVRRRGAIV